jgi:hypothetical protein
MRLAFVIRLGNDTRPAEARFEGWVEEVDPGIELRFRSSEELLSFLGQRFELRTSSTGLSCVSHGEPAAPIDKNGSRRKGP